MRKKSKLLKQAKCLNRWKVLGWNLDELADIRSMDETGCFFNTLPEKGLAEKKSQEKGGKKSKTRLAIAFFVNAAGKKVMEPLVIWRSAKPRCFKNVKNRQLPHSIYITLTKKRRRQLKP